ncbi:hypothetical protein IE987_09320 [Klebsiella pneumoniae]|uniref:Uncharacterized protein n=1 Tax=Klebsiella pneumoniae TaxID=573 RepID=A0A927HNH9_KLEPN|nr:hypothetical protein [Klebsiella pneumoniae]
MAAAPYRVWGTAGRCKLSRPGKRRAARQGVQAGFRPDARWRLRLTGPRGTAGRCKLSRPGKRRAARQGVQAAFPS